MYWLADDAVSFAETKGRMPHERKRCCVVVEGNPSLNRAGSQKVSIVPTSSRTDIKGEFDILIPHPPSPNTDVMVRVEYVQTVLRDELGDYVQQLKADLVDEIMASLGRYFDLL
jgi:mRNA-degrading endonuclease toxin of MazEF toxin-antitoxin module